MRKQTQPSSSHEGDVAEVDHHRQPDGVDADAGFDGAPRIAGEDHVRIGVVHVLRHRPTGDEALELVDEFAGVLLIAGERVGAAQRGPPVVPGQRPHPFRVAGRIHRGVEVPVDHRAEVVAVDEVIADLVGIGDDGIVVERGDIRLVEQVHRLGARAEVVDHGVQRARLVARIQPRARLGQSGMVKSNRENKVLVSDIVVISLDEIENEAQNHESCESWISCEIQ